MPATVRLPRSTTGKRTIGAQLIRRVVQGRPGAFRLDGVFLRPGKLVEESDLRPGPDWPRVPHLIELCPSANSRGGHGGSRIDAILWKYEGGEWRSVVRLSGNDSAGWMLQMGPILERSIAESQPRVEPPDVHAAIDELVAPIAERFAAFTTREQREAFATALYTRLMGIMCESQDDQVQRKPPGLAQAPLQERIESSG